CSGAMGFSGCSPPRWGSSPSRSFRRCVAERAVSIVIEATIDPAEYGVRGSKRTRRSRAMSNVAEKRSAFRRLHESGCFVIPNPWDVGSARYLESLGFPALATTSGGAAWSLGYADGGVPRDTMLEHIAGLVA